MNSTPQTDATTFAFASVYILLLCIRHTKHLLADHHCAQAEQHPDQAQDHLPGRGCRRVG